MPRGRPKGAVNKFTKSVKDVFISVFHELQKDPEQSYSLEKWAKANPSDYYKLANKMVPQGVEVTGENGGALTFVVKRSDTDAT